MVCIMLCMALLAAGDRSESYCCSGAGAFLLAEQRVREARYFACPAKAVVSSL